MNAVHYTENGLNVHYIGNFIEKTSADRYFAELRTLPFYRPTFRLRGKDVMPKRLVLAYGEPNTSYAFSGTSIPANPWTPLMIELRDRVEKQTACTYNYVLLNLYQDGTTYISHHKDNEPCLNATFPITVLSFGAQRTIEFRRPNVPSTSIDLEHGSFYSMEKPTNELFTHGIASDPAVKDMRISLTFRHISPSNVSLKKPRLNLDLFTVSPISSSSEDTNNLVIPNNSVISPSREELEFPQNDWFSNLFQQMDIYTIAYWDLGWNTLVKVQLLKNSNLRIDIRNYKEGFAGELFPTKSGISMTCATFDYFEQNLSKFYFSSLKDSFVANNQLFMAFLDQDYCLLQQIFKSEENSFYFKPEGLRLSRDQFLKLDEFSSEIIKCLIETILTKAIPQSILLKTGVCKHHLTEDEAKENFLTCFNHELESSVYNVFNCFSCTINQQSQLDHDCLSTSLREKFCLCKDSALLNFNVFQFVKTLQENCMCHYNSAFFKTLNANFFYSYLETVFVSQKDNCKNNVK